MRRGLFIAGFAAVAWLAGTAGANADSGQAEAETLLDSTPITAELFDSPAPRERTDAGESTPSPDLHRAESPVDAVTAEASGRVLRLTDSVAAPLAKQVAPAIVTPLKSAARPVADELKAVWQPADGTLTRIARPVVADTKPFNAMLSWAEPTDLAGNAEPVRDDRRPHAAVAGDRGHAANVYQDRTATSIRAAHDGRSADVEPFSGTDHSDVYAVTGPGGGIGTGLGSTGSPTHDNGAGVFISAADTAVNAGTSRVDPATATAGQPRERVADPAVSPD